MTDEEIVALLIKHKTRLIKNGFSGTSLRALLSNIMDTLIRVHKLDLPRRQHILKLLEGVKE